MSKSARSSIKLTFMTMISRLLGLVRDNLQARFFGTSIISEYWEIAYMFPNMLRNLLAEGILSQSFIPIYSDSLKISEQKAREDSGKIIIFLSLLLSLIVFLGIISFPFVLPYYVGRPKNEISLLITLSQILFGFIGFVSITSIFSGILFSHQKFIIPSLSPIFLNLAFIITFLSFLILSTWVVFSLEVIAIVLSIVILVSSFLIMLIQYYFVKKHHWEPSFKFSFLIFKDPIIKKLFYLVAPAVLGASIFQLNQLLDIFLASYFVKIEGAIPAMRFAHRLIQLPTGIIGVAISTTILPIISSFIRKGESPEKSSEEIVNAIRFSLFLTIPATIGLFILAPWIIHFLFSGGLWDIRSTFITVWTLQFYTLGIPFYSINKILTSTYYAYQDTKTPVKILIFVVVLNLAMNIILIPILQHGGLSLSTSLSSLMNTILLVYFLKYKPLKLNFKELIDFLKRILFLGLVLTFFLLMITEIFYFPYQEKRFSLEFLSSTLFSSITSPSRKEAINVILFGIGGSLLIYFFIAQFLLKKEMQVILSIIHRKK